MIGVSVQVKGTATGGITDMDGKFQVNVSSADAVLVFSYMGYQTEEVKVGQQSDLTIRMKEDGELLEEVVVIGYGTQKRKMDNGMVYPSFIRLRSWKHMKETNLTVSMYIIRCS